MNNRRIISILFPFLLDYSYDPNFVAPNHGPATAVCVDKLNNLHVMYRSDRIWDATTFDGQNRYIDVNQGNYSVWKAS